MSRRNNFKDRKLSRLPNWDYGSDSDYYVTICTKNREHFLGEIKNKKIHYSLAGVIAFILWKEIKNHAKYVELGEFVIMPNHIHGIISIRKNQNNIPQSLLPTIDLSPKISVQLENVLIENIPTINPNNQVTEQNGTNKFRRRKNRTLSSIIGSYKAAVKKYCNQLEIDFNWQVGFYDSIIRTTKELENIILYIKNNPANWKDDEFF